MANKRHEPKTVRNYMGKTRCGALHPSIGFSGGGGSFIRSSSAMLIKSIPSFMGRIPIGTPIEIDILDGKYLMSLWHKGLPYVLYIPGDYFEWTNN